MHIDWITPFFLIKIPFLSNDLLKPSITIGTTNGLHCLIRCAVPLRSGLNGVVVPWGKVITQPSFRAIEMLVISDILTSLFISLLPSLHVLSIGIEPA